MRQVTGKITGLTRRLNSPSGNPRWTVWIDGVPFNSGLDYSVGYDIQETWSGTRVEAQVSGSTLVQARQVSDGVRT